ncbi:MAG: amino acid ABC transporter permease [Dermatophilaceae bacterium]|jgi:glutamate transport system permease protein|nr:amino acid ABC transporter permease [Dermatophilaceae bacterium]MBP9917133.1 amino acid ABC transporter permease [Dermatophilaceae bacterium]
MSSVLFDIPGPKAKARHRIVAIVAAVLTIAAVGWMLARFQAKGNLDADKWTPFLTSEIWVNYLVPGLINTIKAAVLSMILAGLFGLVFGLGRLSDNRAIRAVSTVIVEFFRSVPVLVMMVAAFGLYSTNKVFVSDINPLAAVVTALTLYNGSVVAELLRSGVGGLPKGQSEAGLAIGLTRSQTLRSILLPQAITAMLPALVSQLVVILKDTALGAIITFPETLNTFSQIGSYKSNPVPALIVIALIFIAINYVLTSLASRVEASLRDKGRATIAKGTIGPPNALDLKPVEEALILADEKVLQKRYHSEGQ